MNDEQIKNAMGTITYLKTTGEIVGFDNNINTPLSSLLDAYCEVLTTVVTMEDADGAEVTMKVPVQVPGVGEMLAKASFPDELDQLYISRADSKDIAYSEDTFDITTNWKTTGMSINGEDVDVQHSPQYDHVMEIINDPVKGPVEQTRMRDMVKSDDSNFSHIDTRMLLIDVADWPLDQELSAYLETKKIDHANRRIIDAD